MSAIMLTIFVQCMISFVVKKIRSKLSCSYVILIILVIHFSDYSIVWSEESAVMSFTNSASNFCVVSTIKNLEAMQKDKSSKSKGSA